MHQTVMVLTLRVCLSVRLSVTTLVVTLFISMLKLRYEQLLTALS